MTSGKPRTPLPQAEASRRRLLLATTAAALCSLGRPAQAAAFDLDALSALLRQRPQAQARFSEERFVDGLSAPLQSSGTLSFIAPDHVARHTLQPRAESMVVDGNTLVLRRSGRTRQMAVDAVPELAALVNTLRATFNGDLTALQQQFQLQLTGQAEEWRLSLHPRAGRIAQMLRLIEMRGRGGELRRLELVLSDGDRSVMQITPLPSAQAGQRPAPSASPPAPRP